MPPGPRWPSPAFLQNLFCQITWFSVCRISFSDFLFLRWALLNVHRNRVCRNAIHGQLYRDIALAGPPESGWNRTDVDLVQPRKTRYRTCIEDRHFCAAHRGLHGIERMPPNAGCVQDEVDLVGGRAEVVGACDVAAAAAGKGIRHGDLVIRSDVEELRYCCSGSVLIGREDGRRYVR